MKTPGNRFLRKLGLTSAVALGAATTAYAVPVHFDIDGAASSVSLSVNYNHTAASNPSVSLASGLDGNIFDLDLDGGPTSATFDFFNLYVDGFDPYPDGGTISAEITADLVFSDPTASAGGGADVSLSYSTVFDGCGWWSCDYDTVLNGGSLVWDPQPSNVVLSDGTEFSVTLSDLPAIQSGYNTVSATVTLIGGPGTDGTDVLAVVPEPTTLALLSVGLIGFGLRRPRARLPL